eukprot:UN02378
MDPNRIHRNWVVPAAHLDSRRCHRPRPPVSTSIPSCSSLSSRSSPPVASPIISSHIVRRRCHQIQRPHVRCDCRPRWLPHIHALPTDSLLFCDLVVITNGRKKIASSMLRPQGNSRADRQWKLHHPAPAGSGRRRAMIHQGHRREVRAAHYR